MRVLVKSWRVCSHRCSVQNNPKRPDACCKKVNQWAEKGVTAKHQTAAAGQRGDPTQVKVRQNKAQKKNAPFATSEQATQQ